MIRSHTTKPADSGTHHLWEVGDDVGSVSLSLLHSRHPGFAGLAEKFPFAARNVAATDGGHWVFDAISSHRFGVSWGWGCSEHGDDCDASAFTDLVADPIWQRLRENGVTDATVFAALEALFADEFEAAS